MAYDPDNILARILRDELSSERVYEDAEFLAIRDAFPQAPTHILVLPKGDGPISPADLHDEDAPWVGRMVLLGTRIAREQGLTNGYRLVMNSGADGGQAVPHLHMHVMGGHSLSQLG